MAHEGRLSYPAVMLKPHPNSSETSEAPADRTARLMQERALIAEGEAAIAAGRVIADEDVDAWLERLVEPPAPRA